MIAKDERRLRVGVLGCGPIAQAAHLEACVKARNADLYAICDVAARRAWVPYERGWASAQKERSKLKSGMPFALWQASADEGALELFAAHIAPSGVGSFNPLLGNGGKKGQRDFSEGWNRCACLSRNRPKEPASRCRWKAGGIEGSLARRASRLDAERSQRCLMVQRREQAL